MLLKMVYSNASLRFVYSTENLYQRVRNKIYQEPLKRINNYPEITIETEEGPMIIRDNINYIKNLGFFGGEIEISKASEIYDINLATYKDNNQQSFSILDIIIMIKMKTIIF